MSGCARPGVVDGWVCGGCVCMRVHLLAISISLDSDIVGRCLFPLDPGRSHGCRCEVPVRACVFYRCVRACFRELVAQLPLASERCDVVSVPTAVA